MNIKYGMLFLLFVLNGCVVGPNYRASNPCVSDAWVGGCAQAEPLSDWWRVFQDPLLDRYITKAALYNNDILIAEANVLEARAQRKIAAAPFLPLVGFDFNYTKLRLSKNGLFPSLNPLSQLPIDIPFLQTPLVQKIFTPIFDATWELDFFGKTSRSVEMAQATLESKMEAQNDILVTVLGEVAKTYMNIRGYQKQQALTVANIALLEQIEKITKQRVNSGLDNALAQHNIQAELAELRSTLPALQGNIYLGIYSLSVLMGYPPECLLEEMLPMKALPCPPAEIELGLRSDILRRRPDVRKAERELHAATAGIGVATAQFFPSFSLFGIFGWQSEVIKKLFDWQSRNWLYSANMFQPVFTGGKLTGNLCRAKAKQIEACQTYQKTILTALQEAQSSLTSFIEDRVTTKQLRISVEESRRTRDLTLKQYENGLVDLKTLLDYDRSLISREQQLTTSEMTTLTDLISLYKALGGGWQCSFIGP